MTTKRSYKHQIRTDKVIKQGLTNFDDKRYSVDVYLCIHASHVVLLFIPRSKKEPQTTSQQQEQSASKVIDKTYLNYLNLFDSLDDEEIEEDMLQCANEQSLLDSGRKKDRPDIAILLKEY
ncbi:hypothetical protein CHS0354_030524 [Potamilus streckersoni]|uniref:Uncharacterized protein n=1 Tax=Potamilus streckersoni TaxID=2493646 RepID=A0AAE0VGB4_9BIVA|nr:hypothetical protein CHS0354_030524 [Potamilus streckersoni]